MRVSVCVRRCSSRVRHQAEVSQSWVGRSGEGEHQHTLSGSTEAPRSRSGSFSFLSCSLTLILMMMSVSCETAPVLCVASMFGEFVEVGRRGEEAEREREREERRGGWKDGVWGAGLTTKAVDDVLSAGQSSAAADTLRYWRSELPNVGRCAPRVCGGGERCNDADGEVSCGRVGGTCRR